jgi:hypothetical protein
MIAAEQLICPGCGDPFTPRSSLQKFHHTNCKNRAFRRGQNEQRRSCVPDSEPAVVELLRRCPVFTPEDALFVVAFPDGQAAKGVLAKLEAWL